MNLISYFISQCGIIFSIIFDLIHAFRKVFCCSYFGCSSYDGSRRLKKFIFFSTSLLVFLVTLSLFPNEAFGQKRIYATKDDLGDGLYFGCNTSIEGFCPNFQLDVGLASDGLLDTYGEAEFGEEDQSFFGVYFFEIIDDGVGNFFYRPLVEKKIGIKLGFDNDIFGINELNSFVQSISVYATDEIGEYLLDDSGNPIKLEFDPDLIISNLKLGVSTFEIVTEQINTEFYGIRMDVDNTNGDLNDLPFLVYEFYVLGSTCDTYLDYLYTNSLNNGGGVSGTNGGVLDLKPCLVSNCPGELDVSFLFDSFSIPGDFVSIIFEFGSDVTLSSIDDILKIQPFSDNEPLGNSYLDLENVNSSLIKNGSNYSLKFPISVAFNRIKIAIIQDVKIKDLRRESGGGTLDVSFQALERIENNEFWFPAGGPITLSPEIIGYNGDVDFEWDLDPAFNSSNSSMDGNVLTIFPSDGCAPCDYVFFVSAIDPVTGCKLTKEINFKALNIRILTNIDFTLTGKLQTNKTILINWDLKNNSYFRFNKLSLERAGDDLIFSSIFNDLSLNESNIKSFIDLSPKIGNNFYRLVVDHPTIPIQVYSQVVNVINYKDESKDEYLLYPNPFVDKLFFKTNQLDLKSAYFFIHSLDGVLSKELDKEGEVYQSGVVEFNLEFLPNGFYIFTIKAPDFSRSYRILKK
ncbi:T9SS type A sorting domain-containing protein [Algoriphagus aquatilis]|uniref:T9SS type A sorting domain-containing protein n=1 Tax=Algoriphagus aquatilis TaxID=490186 RepID=A0ABW0C235_9BACT